MLKRKVRDLINLFHTLRNEATSTLRNDDKSLFEVETIKAKVEVYCDLQIQLCELYMVMPCRSQSKRLFNLASDWCHQQATLEVSAEQHFDKSNICKRYNYTPDDIQEELLGTVDAAKASVYAYAAKKLLELYQTTFAGKRNSNINIW